MILSPLERARMSLEGLSLGDAFGEQFFMSWEMAARLIQAGEHPGPPYDFTDDAVIGRIIARRQLPSELKQSVPINVRVLNPATHWRWTDDTQMALCIFENLRRFGRIEPDALAMAFSVHFSAEPARGYGAAMHSLLPRLLLEDWRQAAPQLFDGQGSFGNGAAMRVAPIGAYFADDLQAAVENARLSAQVTHAHPEAIAGAIAVAVATALLWQAREDNEEVQGRALLNAVLPFVPESQVREGIVYARGMVEDAEFAEVVAVLGTGEDVTAQDTVPFCLWCAAKHPRNYEDALWQTVAGLGDRDTTCAIVGGIVGAENLPHSWLQERESLPEWPFED